jgi:transcriptional repressor NrdR
MRCPFCRAEKDRLKVIDSRSCEDGRAIRRRRSCLECDKRFTTYERVEVAPKLLVVKKTGDRQAWQRGKIIAGLQLAAFKLDVTEEQLAKIADDVEDEALRNFEREVPSDWIGHKVGSKLRDVDQVAYVRFASVYKKFKTAEEFLDEAQQMIDARQKSEAEADQQHLFVEPESIREANAPAPRRRRRTPARSGTSNR